MTNFIFKSSTTLKKLANTLEVILNEQRHQRNDLSVIIALINKLIHNDNLQKTVDEYYETHPDRELDDKEPD